MLSAVQSAIKGGLLFSRKALSLAQKHGYIHRGPDDTYLDETVGFTVALFGFYTQCAIASVFAIVLALVALSGFYTQCAIASVFVIVLALVALSGFYTQWARAPRSVSVSMLVSVIVLEHYYYYYHCHHDHG